MRGSKRWMGVKDGSEPMKGKLREVKTWTEYGRRNETAEWKAGRRRGRGMGGGGMIEVVGGSEGLKEIKKSGGGRKGGRVGGG